MDIDPALVTPEIAADVARVKVEPNPPGDFVAFWTRTVEELESIPLDLEVRENLRPADEYGTYGEWYATSLGGRRIGGPLTLPSNPAGGQWVYSHGYGSIANGTTWAPQLAKMGFIAVGLDARGYNRSRQSGDPAVPGWAVHGIQDRSTYILRGAVADLIRAVQVARSFAGADPKRTVLTGGSFAGGLATLAAPWIDQLAYIALRVPTFGAYKLRQTLVHRGSGAEVNTLRARLSENERIELDDRLRYFDAVNAAHFIRGVPVTVGLGVSDVVVPGETVAAIFHALSAEDKELLWYPCSHSTHELARRWTDFENHVHQRALEIV